jgi:phosphoenolpyruvate synthase/pyruvate phosphate dikinase
VLLAVPLPATLSPVAIERLDDQQAEPQPAGENLHGVCVAGSHDVVGRVRVLHDAADLARLRPGDILVTRCTDPCWLPAFAIAGGLVTEIGGWLSHAAIQARERDLPTIVSAVGCTRRLRDGELVRLCRDGTIVQLAELRERHRHRVDFPATLHGGGMVVQVRVLDLNRLGAGIEVSTRSLATRAEYELQFAEVRVRAELAWANCQRIGLRFVQPLALDQDSPLQQTG